MSVKRINYTSKFRKEFERLPKTIKLLAVQRELLFKEAPFNSTLKTHKLQGKSEGFYSFSVSYSYRIVFIFESSEEVTFFEIGTHSIYK